MSVCNSQVIKNICNEQDKNSKYHTRPVFPILMR